MGGNGRKWERKWEKMGENGSGTWDGGRRRSGGKCGAKMAGKLVTRCDHKNLSLDTRRSGILPLLSPPVG